MTKEQIDNYFKNTPKEKIQEDWEKTVKATEGVKSPSIEEYLDFLNTIIDSFHICTRTLDYVDIGFFAKGSHVATYTYEFGKSTEQVMKELSEKELIFNPTTIIELTEKIKELQEEDPLLTDCNFS